MGRYMMRFINATASIRRINIKKLITLGVILLCLLIAFLIYKADVGAAYVFCDNVQHRVMTLSDNPEEIVAKAGITLDDKNSLVLDYFHPEDGERVVVVAEPHNVAIYDDGKQVASINVAGTVKSALDKAGIALKDGDSLNYDEQVGITGDMKIEITRAFPVKIKVDGKEKTVNVTGGTVEGVLRQAGINLGQFDEISKKMTKELTKKTSLVIKRIAYKTETKTVKTDFKTKVEYDDSMYEDQRKVKKKGVKGKSVNEYKYTYVDGKITETEILSSKVVKEPVTQILVRGTKVRSTGFTGASVKSGRVISELKPPFEIPLNKNGRPVKYKKVITGKATAYCTGTTCSTGAPAMPGRVAVDPREIPYGTKMYIVSSDGKWNYGYCIASDTGGFIYNSSTVVDLYMRGYSTCRSFGRRNVDIYILEWGNGIKNWRTH
ncbi:MAG: G5 domain-containing protein [Clostridia bacterium]|nr:G5 domain-containing protein [Clostridia bacterium]